MIFGAELIFITVSTIAIIGGLAYLFYRPKREREDRDKPP